MSQPGRRNRPPGRGEDKVAVAPSGAAARWGRRTRSLFTGLATLASALIVAALLAGEPVGALAPATGGTAAQLSGRILFADTRAAADVAVDLFTGGLGGGGGSYLSSAVTDAQGRFSFDVRPGCYVIVAAAPAGASFHTGARHWRQSLCAGDGAAGPGLDLVLRPASAGRPRITGVVTSEHGWGLPGWAAELYQVDGRGERGRYLRSAPTDDDGRFGLDVDPGCYLIVLRPPTTGTGSGNGSVTGARPGSEEPVCVRSGEVELAPAAVAGPAPADQVSLVEDEIVALTNALRADPAGPLARVRPLPGCVSDPYYGIDVDPATGAPRPVPALAVDPSVSAVLARTWAAEMRRSGQFAHRLSNDAYDLYLRLERDVTAWGENIAWFSGFDPARAALVHFEGWRESDDGHYCALVTGRFTHVGVGEVTDGDQSWAVQNFYR